MRIGVLGGTFDPVHVAHLVAAADARHALALDRVLLVVANIPWQKAGRRDITPAEDRYAMVAAALEDIDGLEPSRLEIDRGGPSYTVDTLQELHAEHRGAELFLIVGGDVVRELSSWARADALPDLAQLVVVDRPGESWMEPPARFRAHRLEIPALEISGTDIRRRVRAGFPIDFLVPPGAVRVIRERGLYAGPG
jgi:nicotinate-nucleotide adenylyltransferase